MVTIQIDGWKAFIQVAEGLREARVKLRDMREPLKDILKQFYEVERLNFEHEGTEKQFRRLSPQYAAWKAAHFPGKTVLRLHDNLYAALTGGEPKDKSKARPIRKITLDGLQVGVESPYYGRQAAWGREAIQVREGDWNDWNDYLVEWAAEVLESLAFRRGA